MCSYIYWNSFKVKGNFFLIYDLQMKCFETCIRSAYRTFCFGCYNAILCLQSLLSFDLYSFISTGRSTSNFYKNDREQNDELLFSTQFLWKLKEKECDSPHTTKQMNHCWFGRKKWWIKVCIVFFFFRFCFPFKKTKLIVNFSDDTVTVEEVIWSLELLKEVTRTTTWVVWSGYCSTPYADASTSSKCKNIINDELVHPSTEGWTGSR